MSKIKLLTREEFDELLKPFHMPEYFDMDYCFKIYEYANEIVDELCKHTSKFIKKDINQNEIAYYAAGECFYSMSANSKDFSFLKTEEAMNQIAGVVGDKYLSLSLFNHTETKLTNKFLPPVSSLDIYLNFMLNVLNSYKKNDPRSTLITDLLDKSISISRCILKLLLNGFETEAYSSWRTLHECESTLIILEKYGSKAIDSYLKHMNYGLAFSGNVIDKELADRIFFNMKEEMKTHNLKSKDIKKYIEYGWLYVIPEFNEEEGYKLNFRDGLEKLAGLEKYNKRYNVSSEIIHSTPLLIYSRKESFYYYSLLNLYESFFRLEKVFVSLLSKRLTEEQMNQYVQMRNIYYAQLVSIHRRESATFANLQKQNKIKNDQ